MSNPPRQKGTGGEREVLLAIEREMCTGVASRRPPSSPYDIEVPGTSGRTIRALATRPDRGEWLVTVTLKDLVHLAWHSSDRFEIEVKRHKAFSQHTLWDKEMKY
mgnify:CR=1 FL=1